MMKRQQYFEHKRIQMGDVFLYKRGGFTATILGGLLKLLNPSWDGWGWHLAICTGRYLGGFEVLEALGGGVTLNKVDEHRLGSDIRVYRVMQNEPSLAAVQELNKVFIGRPYDVAIYFWTALAIIIRHYVNRPIPKLLDNRYSCWELAQEWLCHFGIELCSPYDVVIITDIMKFLEGKRIR